MIPSELVGVELAQDGTKLGNHWFDVQALFSGGDRCVEIVDPIGILLDLLETVPPESLANVAYFVNRLPTDPDATRRLLRRTFRSFRTSAADRPGFEAKIEKTIVVADQARQTAASHPPWIDDVSSKTGTSVSVLIELMDAVNSADIGQSSVEELANWILDWCDNPGRARALMRSRVFEDLVPGNTPDGRTLKWEHEWQTLRASLRTATQAWLRGQPLSMIDELFQRQRKVGGLRYARKFALRFMPELSFAAGVILGLLRARSEAGEGLSPSIELVTAPPCLRAGLDGPGPLATSYCLREGVSRREARERWAEIAPNVAVLPSDGFGTWIVSVRRALNADEPVAV